jgi:hypothetical protein
VSRHWAFRRSFESSYIDMAFRPNCGKLNVESAVLCNNTVSWYRRWESHAFTLFLMIDATRRRVSAGTGTVRRTRGLAQPSREMYPWSHSSKLSRNGMPGSVRQGTVVVLIKKTSLHFNCWKTTDGLAQAGYNVTWPAWDLVQSQRYSLFITPIELYWIAIINKYFNVSCVTFTSPCYFFYSLAASWYNAAIPVYFLTVVSNLSETEWPEGIVILLSAQQFSAVGHFSKFIC